MDLSEYRQRPLERQRTANLLEMLGSNGGCVLDVGARDGHLSSCLASSFQTVVALDLEAPDISDQRVVAVKGNVTCLEYPDNSFDAVVCSEVLEHIPTRLLEKACNELSRVARHDILIGVPYKQDIRIGRTACLSCGKHNPPWGHVNVFDEDRLKQLFPRLSVSRISYVGEIREATNALASFLMDIAGNPWGTYDQEEGCVNCGARLRHPPQLSLVQRVFARSSVCLSRAHSALVSPHPNWIHVLFQKSV